MRHNPVRYITTFDIVIHPTAKSLYSYARWLFEKKQNIPNISMTVVICEEFIRYRKSFVRIRATLSQLHVHNCINLSIYVNENSKKIIIINLPYVILIKQQLNSSSISSGSSIALLTVHAVIERHAHEIKSK